MNELFRNSLNKGNFWHVFQCPPRIFLQPKYCLKIIRPKTILKSVGAIERNQKAKLHRDSMENCHFWHWNSRYSSRIPVVNIPRLNIFEWTLSIISKSLLRLCAMKTWNCFFEESSLKFSGFLKCIFLQGRSVCHIVIL